MAIGSIALWSGFIGFILVMLALDLGVFNRKAHAVSTREALVWSILWVSLALIFNAGLWHWFGKEAALQFFTGYLIEKALSVDNLFVFLVLFSFFSVKPEYQHRVLFWGVLGALVMRAIFILGGAALLDRFHWTIYVFGGLLLATGIKLLVRRTPGGHPESNPIIRLARRYLPTTSHYHGAKFFARINGKIYATPLLIVLIAVEATDLVFAVDSIPAIFAITKDPFIVFTSNIFAILGLRSLYFLLAGVMYRFRYLKIGLALVLIFVGTKMMISEWYKLPVPVSLVVVATLICGAIALSMWRTNTAEERTVSERVIAG